MTPDPVNTPPGYAAILRELDALHATIREDRAEVKDELSTFREEAGTRLVEFQDETRKALGAVLKEQKITNGRVSKLEAWRYGIEVVAAARSWVKPALVAFVSGAALTVLGWVLYNS